MNVKVEVNEEIFKRAKEKLSPSQIAGAMRMAMNDSVRKGRTMVRRAVQSGYNIQANVINDKSPKKGLSIKFASGRDLSAEIRAGHTPLSIKDANPRFTGVQVASKVSYKGGKAKKGKALRRSTSQISIEIIKGQRKTLASAFTIGVGQHNGGTGQFGTGQIFARGKKGKPGFVFAKPRYSIDSISTISVATAAANDRSLDQYGPEVNQHAQQRFIHHIERLIKKVDGLE